VEESEVFEITDETALPQFVLGAVPESLLEFISCTSSSVASDAMGTEPVA
jgi:hypothetical protein